MSRTAELLATAEKCGKRVEILLRPNGGLSMHIDDDLTRFELAGMAAALNLIISRKFAVLEAALRAEE